MQGLKVSVTICDTAFIYSNLQNEVAHQFNPFYSLRLDLCNYEGNMEML